VQPSLEQSLVWVDRNGNPQPFAFSSLKAYSTPRISKDRIAVAIHPAGSINFGSRDIWKLDLLRGTDIPLTSNGLSYWEVWSPDGKRLVYSSSVSGIPNLFVMNANGTGQQRLTTSPNVQAPSSWTENGNLVAFVEAPAGSLNWKIWVLPMDGDRKPKLFYETQSALYYPTFSPDGHYIAYGSMEAAGQPAVYVQPYPGPGERLRISPGIGSEPIWSADGHELFYRERQREGQKFFAVTILSTNPIRTEAPRRLFEAKPREYEFSTPLRLWDVDRDGQHFLLIRTEESKEKPVTQIHAVLNWTEELKHQSPLTH